MITLWWTRRSIAAAVVIASLKIWSHLQNARLLVDESDWNKFLPGSGPFAGKTNLDLVDPYWAQAWLVGDGFLNNSCAAELSNLILDASERIQWLANAVSAFPTQRERVLSQVRRT